MKPRPGRRISALATLMLVAFVTFQVIAVRYGLQNPVDPFSAVDLSFGLSLITFPVVGWLIAVRRPQNRLGWIFLSFSLAIVISAACEEFAFTAAESGFDFAAALLLIVGGWFSALGFWLFTGPALMLFPDGRIPGARFRWTLWGSAALALGLAITSTLGSEIICVDRFFEASDPCLRSVENPLGLLRGVDLSLEAEALLLGLNSFLLVVSFTSIIVRYRRSTGEVRQQIKWVAWLAVVGLLSTAVVYVGSEILELIPGEWADLAIVVVLILGIPAAIGIAILKYRLYDIDRIISRTAAYTLVIAILAVVYVFVVALMQRILPFESQLGTVVSTLVVAVLFNPLRRRLQRAIDRRFYRSRYDAQQVLAAFSNQLRDNVDLEQVQDMLLRVTQETMQPEFINLWMLRVDGN